MGDCQGGAEGGHTGCPPPSPLLGSWGGQEQMPGTAWLGAGQEGGRGEVGVPRPREQGWGGGRACRC